MRSGPLVMCLIAVAGAAAGAALVMEPPRPSAAKPIAPASLTVIDPVATEDVGTLVHLASEMTVRGDFAQAIDTLTRAVNVAPPTASLHLQRGLVHLRLNDLDSARADFNSALALEETAAGPVAGMGLIWLASGEHDKAIQCFDLALSRDPSLGYAWRGRAEILVARDDHAAAIAAFDEALRLDSRDARSLLLRARSRALTKDTRGALDDANRAIQLAPWDMDAWYTLGSLHLLRREFDETIKAADRALTIDAASPDMLALRAWARNARGKTKAAAEDANAALQLAPEDWRHRPAMTAIAKAGQTDETPPRASASETPRAPITPKAGTIVITPSGAEGLPEAPLAPTSTTSTLQQAPNVQTADAPPATEAP